MDGTSIFAMAILALAATSASAAEDYVPLKEVVASLESGYQSIYRINTGSTIYRVKVMQV